MILYVGDKQKIKRLDIYLDKCKNRVREEKNEHKKAFFQREVTKTSKAIESLR